MMNKPSLRDIKKEATARALTTAAFELAHERGLDGFIVEDIVQRAGYSRRTFANYFSCKEEAVAMSALIVNGTDDAEHLLADLSENVTPIEVLYQLAKTQFTAELLKKLRELTLLSKRHPTLEPHVLNVFRGLQTASYELLDELCKDRYPEGYKELLLGAVYGAILHVTDGSVNVLLSGEAADDMPEAKTFDQYLETLFGYLRNGF